MKPLIILLSFLFNSTHLASSADDILGVWMNATAKGQVQIYREGNKYFGKIIWLAEPNDAKGLPKTDKNNSDPNLRSKPLLGAIVLRGFVYDNGEWNSGRIYDPQNGKDYKCYLKLKDPRTLNVRGYIGISWIGRTETWTKVR
ncbi:MAG: DUF2147 domain-containing protein [Chitinophagaceae bacterium]|nr:DUF2147 domain-containing protein [Chitinophagaceae bacterium]